MPVFECTSRVIRRSLMNQTKDELATRVLELMEEIGTIRDRMAKVEARCEVAVEREGLDRLELNVIYDTRLSAEERVARVGNSPRYDAVRDGRPYLPWPSRTGEAEMEAAMAPLFAPVPTRDSDLPAVVSPCA